mgnify:CR=1 FL=1
MAGTINPEDAVNGVISVLGASLPAQLDALDTAYTDSVVLADVAAYLRAPQEEYPDMPCAVVVARSAQRPEEFRNENIWWVELEIQVYLVGHETLASYQGVTLTPQELVAIRLSRTMRAVEEVLEANTHLPISGVHYADHVLVASVEYSNFAPHENGMMRGARMLVQVLVSP